MSGVKDDVVRVKPLLSDYMTASPHSIGIDQTIAAAETMMRDLAVRHLPVLDDGHIVGMLSERDVRRAAGDASKLIVDAFMQDDVYVVDATALLSPVARHMAEHRLGSAVVMSYGSVVGILTTVDVCRALADALH